MDPDKEVEYTGVGLAAGLEEVQLHGHRLQQYSLLGFPSLVLFIAKPFYGIMGLEFNSLPLIPVGANTGIHGVNGYSLRDSASIA